MILNVALALSRSLLWRLHGWSYAKFKWIETTSQDWLLEFTIVTIVRSSSSNQNRFSSNLPRLTLPKFNIAPEKWMVGIRSFPFGKVTFEGRAVKLRDGI